MSCRDRQEQLFDYARGMGAETARAETDAHVAGCPGCAARLRREMALSADLRALAEATSASAMPDGDAAERRLLAEFERVAATRGPAAVGFARPAASGSAVSSAAARVPRAWLAAAAVVALVAGGVGAWRGLSSIAGREGHEPRLLIAKGPGPSPLAMGLPEVRPGAPPVASRSVAGVNAGRVAQAQATSADLRQSGRAQGSRIALASGAGFVAWPGAHALPRFESGELVRTELPASVLPLLGFRDEGRAERATVVADVIVGQDGMPRAVRVVR